MNDLLINVKGDSVDSDHRVLGVAREFDGTATKSDFINSFISPQYNEDFFIFLAADGLGNTTRDELIFHNAFFNGSANNYLGLGVFYTPSLFGMGLYANNNSSALTNAKRAFTAVPPAPKFSATIIHRAGWNAGQIEIYIDGIKQTLAIDNIQGNPLLIPTQKGDFNSDVDAANSSVNEFTGNLNAFDIISGIPTPNEIARDASQGQTNYASSRYFLNMDYQGGSAVDNSPNAYTVTSNGFSTVTF